MRVVPLTLKEANAFVDKLHRHHKPVVGHRFSLGLRREDGSLAGVVICGRPVARMVDPATTLEVTRLCTDGTFNACSMLYSAAARTSKEMGFEKIQTYILDEEPGTSLKASGWVLEGHTYGGAWSDKEGKAGRKNDHPLNPKQRWVRYLRKEAA